MLGTKVVQRQDKYIFETVQQLKRTRKKNELAFIKYMHALPQCKNKKMTRDEGYCIYIVLFFSLFLFSLFLSILLALITFFFSSYFFYRRHLRDFFYFVVILFFRFLPVEKNKLSRLYVSAYDVDHLLYY